MTRHHEPVPAWPADGRPSWAPKFRWVVLLLVLILCFFAVSFLLTMDDIHCGFCDD